MSDRGGSSTRWALTIVVVVALAIDAFVHFDLASNFAQVKTSTLSQADLFRVEGVVAIIAALAVLVRPHRLTAAFAFLVAASATVAVVLYRYVDVGAIGPLPNMYDPYWQPTGKWLSAIAEIVAAVAALLLFLRMSSGCPSVRPGARAGQSLSSRSATSRSSGWVTLRLRAEPDDHADRHLGQVAQHHAAVVGRRRPPCGSASISRYAARIVASRNPCGVWILRNRARSRIAAELTVGIDLGDGVGARHRRR